MCCEAMGVKRDRRGRTMPKVLAAIPWLKAISLFGAIANSLNFISTELLGVAEKSASVIFLPHYFSKNTCHADF